MSWTKDRARVAGLTRGRDPDDPELVEARRDLKASRLEAHIHKIVESAPPLTDDQRSRLASLLRPAS